MPLPGWGNIAQRHSGLGAKLWPAADFTIQLYLQTNASLLDIPNMLMSLPLMVLCPTPKNVPSPPQQSQWSGLATLLGTYDPQPRFVTDLYLASFQFNYQCSIGISSKIRFVHWRHSDVTEKCYVLSNSDAVDGDTSVIFSTLKEGGVSIFSFKLKINKD